MAHEPTIQDQFRPSDEALAGLSTAIAGLYHEHFGKGPTKAKTYALDDVVICILRDGLTTVEKTLFGRGRGDEVREMRSAFQEAVADRFTRAVEDATGRRVIAFMSQAHVNPDLAIEVFCLGPLAAREARRGVVDSHSWRKSPHQLPRSPIPGRGFLSLH